MNMRMMDRISDILCKELEEIADKGAMSMGDLEIAYKATGAIKNIEKLRMMEDGDSYRGNSYDGNSYRSRHWVRGHYSMSDGRREMMDRMQSMMDNEDMSMAERNSFARAMDALAR